MMLIKNTSVTLCAAAALLLMAPADSRAEAGRVLFVFGNATVTSVDGSTARASKGLTLESGDRVVTSANGRVQIRMTDGGLIALRPSTEFSIEAYSYTPASGPAAGPASGDRSFYRLLKGGFRSVTGAVGKADKNAYRVETPVATIGIRGTDYTAVYCEVQCDASALGGTANSSEGLYLGVSEGGVRLTNAGGALDVGAGQYAFVANPGFPPMLSTKAANVVSGFGSGDAEGEDDDTQVTVANSATDRTGEPIDLTEGADAVNPEPGSVAVAAGPLGSARSFSGVSTGGGARLVVDDGGDLTQFTGPFPDPVAPGETVRAEYGLGSSRVIDRGEDPVTSIRWGRWSNGTISVTETGNSQNDLDLGAGSLHWITGSVGENTPVLPTTGSQSFTLIGNTNPTDSAGNVGALGSASLTADFTSQTVDADVSLAIDATNQVWDASAVDVDIESSTASFEGQFDTVTITDTVTSETTQGTGDLAGFFTTDQAGSVSGAGMGYALEDDAGTSVSGAAAFQADPVK